MDFLILPQSFLHTVPRAILLKKKNTGLIGLFLYFPTNKPKLCSVDHTLFIIWPLITSPVLTSI